MIKRVYQGIARRLARYKRDWRKPVLERRTQVPIVQPVVFDTIPHDPKAFTQGLIYQDGRLFESAGLYGASSLRQMKPDGTIVRRIDLPDIFAEDITIFNGELVQLTWRENKALRYSLPSLKEKGVFRYTGEGWGLTSTQDHFIMSNGGGTLLIREKSFKTIEKLRVKLDGRLVNGINALEHVHGKIYANTWRSHFILEIDLRSGSVLRILDCSELIGIEEPRTPDSMLNGIAHCGDGDFFYLAGKCWKNIFLVKFP